MILTDEQVGIIHEAVWRECLAHNMEANEAASVANRAVLRLRELGHYPKKTGSGTDSGFRCRCTDICRWPNGPIPSACRGLPVTKQSWY